MRDMSCVVKLEGEPVESKGFTPSSDHQMGVSTIGKLPPSTPSDWYHMHKYIHSSLDYLTPDEFESQRLVQLGLEESCS